MNFSSSSIPSKFFEWEFFFKYETLNFSSPFSCFLNSNNFFTKLLNFSFMELLETNSFILDCSFTFLSKYHEILLTFNWNFFLHDPTWKYHLMESCSDFQFLVEFSPPTHEIGCSLCLSSSLVLEFGQLRVRWEAENMLKTSQNSHLSFMKVLNISNFRLIFLWLFIFPNHYQMTELWKFIKWVLLIQIWFHQMFWVIQAKNNT